MFHLAGSHGYIYERQKRKYYRTSPAGIFLSKINDGNTDQCVKSVQT